MFDRSSERSKPRQAFEDGGAFEYHIKLSYILLYHKTCHCITLNYRTLYCSMLCFILCVKLAPQRMDFPGMLAETLPNRCCSSELCTSVLAQLQQLHQASFRNSRCVKLHLRILCHAGAAIRAPLPCTTNPKKGSATCYLHPRKSCRGPRTQHGPSTKSPRGQSGSNEGSWTAATCRDRK